MVLNNIPFFSSPLYGGYGVTEIMLFSITTIYGCQRKLLHLLYLLQKSFIESSICKVFPTHLHLSCLGIHRLRDPSPLIVMHVICPPMILWVLVVSYEIGKELGKKVALGELFAIWRGLILAWDMGFRDVCCETDCHEAFILLKNDTSAANNDVTELTRRSHALWKRSWRVELALIQRTANHVADALAKYAVVQNVDQVEWLIPNDDLKELLKHDFLD
ncbi:hypothetical protein PIB30_096074 [Stylosanthes scabra]|uniref:RNase H type-1 domain-containing protein n=1 Tax=Stylosanthes scabra TaxID=79078 RepID=A0ABU6WXN5_9FABA|nr:hypothetical protein [Stylosanthes scabra]